MDKRYVASLSETAIFKVPAEIRAQFNKIASYYLAYTSMTNANNDDKIEYVNEVYNSLNLLNKIIAISVNNNSMLNVQPKADTVVSKESTVDKQESSSQQPSEENEITQNNEIENDESEDGEEIIDISRKDIDDMGRIDFNKVTAKKVIIAELDNLGIDKNTLGYQAYVTIGSIRIKKEDTALDIIEKIAIKLKKSKLTVASAMARVVSKANFEGAYYVPILAKMKREDITKEFLINEFADFKRKP